MHLCVTGTNALECPTNAECVEGFLKAKCRCLPGFNPKYERGVLSCIGRQNQLHNSIFILINL